MQRRSFVVITIIYMKFFSELGPDFYVGSIFKCRYNLALWSRSASFRKGPLIRLRKCQLFVGTLWVLGHIGLCDMCSPGLGYSGNCANHFITKTLLILDTPGPLSTTAQTIKTQSSLVLVAHTYNLSYLGG
jgi:hypothetical protein